MAKQAAFGSMLFMSDMEVSPTFTEIAYVKTLTAPGLKLETDDVTTHDQATAWEELVSTILRSGECKMDLVYDPANATHDAATGLVYAYENSQLTDFQLVFPDNVEWAFSAYVTGFEPSASVSGALTASVTLKLTGEVHLDHTYTP